MPRLKATTRLPSRRSQRKQLGYMWRSLLAWHSTQLDVFTCCAYFKSTLPHNVQLKHWDYKLHGDEMAELQYVHLSCIQQIFIMCETCILETESGQHCIALRDGRYRLRVYRKSRYLCMLRRIAYNFLEKLNKGFRNCSQRSCTIWTRSLGTSFELLKTSAVAYFRCCL